MQHAEASMVSTFTKEQAKQFIGHQIPGKIERIPCKPYEYETDSGEVIELDSAINMWKIHLIS
ncbi:MAG: hypothetical protein R2799_13895 [Crocinitomicaceae bacterium]